MKNTRELRTKDSHAMTVEKWWFKRNCSLLQMSVDVRCNVEPVVNTFAVEVAARPARWTVIGAVFYPARLAIRSNNAVRVASPTVKHVNMFYRATTAQKSSVSTAYTTGAVGPVMAV